VARTSWRRLIDTGELQAAAVKLEAAFVIDPHPALALVLADTQRMAGDIESVLRVLGAAYSAGAYYRDQHLRIVEGLLRSVPPGR
jgi:hypothetical protein